MYDVIFNSGVTGFLIWVLLFAVSTADAGLLKSFIHGSTVSVVGVEI